MVYQDVTRTSEISLPAKGLYAYLASLAGNDGACYPSVQRMCQELNTSEGRLSKCMSELVNAGVVEKVRQKNGNLYGKNVYWLIHKEIPVSEVEDLRHNNFRGIENRGVENRGIEVRGIENVGTTINSITNNSITNNNIDYSATQNMYNEICISFPRVTKLSDHRKKAIKARLNSGYTMDDFWKLFEMAESSSFLKGKNDRNWSANFDWLIKDTNMIKVLEGNYADRQKETNQNEATTTQYHFPAFGS